MREKGKREDEIHKKPEDPEKERKIKTDKNT
jgi:hypothetical protein